MLEKLDFKKQYKDLYLPETTPVCIDVPAMPFIMVDGSGAPEGQEYQQALEILYGLAFTIKMSKMGGDTPPGYMDFTVAPLEGLWNCDRFGTFDADRSRWLWTSMLRQPDFVTADVFDWAKEKLLLKKPGLPLERARLEIFDEGLCVQVMHIGPYSEEQQSIEKITAFEEENGLRDACGPRRRHHEIYISDPRRAKPENIKTVLRHPVERIR